MEVGATGGLKACRPIYTPHQGTLQEKNEPVGGGGHPASGPAPIVGHGTRVFPQSLWDAEREYSLWDAEREYSRKL
jgi:hypothetical protein